MTKKKHADLVKSSRNLTTPEFKKLCDFACIASCVKTSDDQYPATLEENLKTKQRALFEKLGVNNEITRECVKYIAQRFMIEIGVDNDSIYIPPGVPFIDHKRIPDTTKDIADALTEIRQAWEVIDSMKEEGATDKHIDAAFKIFTDHINSKILANSPRIG